MWLAGVYTVMTVFSSVTCQVGSGYVFTSLPNAPVLADGTLTESHNFGLNRDSNPGPLAPKARIIPLDH